MIARLIRASVAHRAIVLVLAVVAMVLGWAQLRSFSFDVLPELERPQTTVLVEVAGLSTSDVETRIALPLEAALAGVDGLSRLEVSVYEGFCVARLTFDWNVVLGDVRRDVAERLLRAQPLLPRGAIARQAPAASIMGEVMLVTATGGDAMELRDLVETRILPRLRALGGVTEASAIGGVMREVHVTLRPEKLALRGITVDEVTRALEGFSATRAAMPLVADGTEQSVSLVTASRDIETIRNLTVATREGSSVSLLEVADVSFAPAFTRGSASVNDRDAVVISVRKSIGADTRKICAEVEAELARLQPSLPYGVVIRSDLFRQDRFIAASMANLIEVLLDAALFVTIVLAIFFFRARPVLVSLLAIPVSFAGALLILRGLGVPMNVMTLGGLAIAVGEVVDDAIIDVENIWRRRRGEEGEAATLVSMASEEVRPSIALSTILMLLFVLPLVSIGGFTGRLLAPLAMAYAAAIFSSLVVATTITPALAAMLLPRRRDFSRPGPTIRGLIAVQGRLVRNVIATPMVTLFLIAVAAVAIFAAASLLPRDFLPRFREGTLTVSAIATPGISLEESGRIAARMERDFLAIDGVSVVARRTGRTELDEHAVGVNFSEFDLRIASGHDETAITDAVRARLAAYPGFNFEIGTPISHRIDHLLAGATGDIIVRLRGDDSVALAHAASDVAEILHGIDGISSVTSDASPSSTRLIVRPDATKAARHGLAKADVQAAAELALGGIHVAEFQQGMRRIPIRLAVATGRSMERPNQKGGMDRIAEAMILVGNGNAVPLREVATIIREPAAVEIHREGNTRRVLLQARVAEGRLTEATESLRRKLAEAGVLPAGVAVELEGRGVENTIATRRLAISAGLVLLLAYALLLGHFGSHRLVWCVLANVPLAAMGVFAALLIARAPVTIPALLGLVTVSGIALRNGILLVDRWAALRRAEHLQPIHEASRTRIIPLAMTALSAIAGLIPVAFASGTEGLELLQPLAVAMLGGLVMATVLDVVVTPAWLRVFASKGSR